MLKLNCQDHKCWRNMVAHAQYHVAECLETQCEIVVDNAIHAIPFRE